jgi:hypothetical protein
VLIFAGLLSGQNVPEYRVKAAFLLNFTKFIEWPNHVFEAPTSALKICILGDDPFGPDIDRLAEGEIVNGRRVLVERFRRVPPPRTCHIVFVGKSEANVPVMLNELGTGVLTVSDRDRFLMEGGMIAFVLDNKNVRFDVNQGAALRASLMINARMLNVARSVQRQR